MKDWLIGEFQANVEHLLIRHKSVLDTMTKITESASRLNRAVTKAATTCGCIEIQSKKTNIDDDVEFDSLAQLASTGLDGHLCNACRNTIERELGSLMFYSAGLCNTLGISLYDTILKEENRLQTLGKFSLR